MSSSVRRQSAIPPVKRIKTTQGDAQPPRPAASRSDSDASDAMEVDESGGEDLEEQSCSDASVDSEERRPTKDIQVDMKVALSGLDFKGSYAMTHAFTLAPNPWLNIEDLGLLRLPLGDDDTARVVSTYGQSSNGTIEDLNTCEIPSEAVSFGNAAWDVFVQKTVLEAVMDGLGLTIDPKFLQFQFHKLQLYRAGSHVSAQQASNQRITGMFATIVILLPSPRTGGDIHVSLSTDSQVLSLPPDSSFHTSLFGWYSDVSHSSGTAIQTGCQLGLHYHLVNTSSKPRPPTLPFPTRAANLALTQQTLKEWRDGQYDKDFEDEDLLAFILNNRYSDDELDQGSSCLEDKDAHVVANLAPVAERAGVTLFLANLEYSVEAQSEWMCRTGIGRPTKRRKTRSDSDDEGNNSSESDDGKIYTYTLSNIVDLGGDSVTQKTMVLEEDQLVPKSPFSGIKPDRYERNEWVECDSDLEENGDYWYERSVVVFLRNDKMRDFYLTNCGIDYAISEMKKLDPRELTKEDLEFAKRAVKQLPSTFNIISPAAADIYEIAISWKMFDLWRAVWEKSRPSAIPIDQYYQALKTFGFEKLRPLFEAKLVSYANLADRINFIRHVSNGAACKDDTFKAWSTAQKFRAIETMQDFSVEDIPTMIKLAEKKGIEQIMNSFVQATKEATVSSDFWIALVKAIRDSKESCTSGEQQATNAVSWQKFVMQYLKDLTMQWVTQNSNAEVTSRAVWHESDIVPSSIEILALTVSHGCADLSSKVLTTILTIRGKSSDQFKLVYAHLIPKLQKILAEHDATIALLPFADFARDVIGLYLQDVLGGKDQVMLMEDPLGCHQPPCKDCPPLEAFVMNSSQATYRFRASAKRREHLERQINKHGRKFLSYKTKKQGKQKDGLHDLVVTKKTEALEATQWSNRQTQAHEFLKTFGDKDMVAQLMGSRAEDVTRALQGTQAFQRYTTSVAAAVVPSSASTAVPPTANKRKRGQS